MKMVTMHEKEEDMMEETLAGVVAEVEKAVRPLGFKVEKVNRLDMTGSKPLFEMDGISEMGKAAADSAELVITIIRKGRLD
jgi:hypothetical protein